MFSFWEQQSLLHFDHVVVGAGITGLNTAINLKEKFPGDRVLVLERGFFTTGASSRNAGFACMGSVSELCDDLLHMNEREVYELFEWRKNGLDRLRKRLGDKALGYAERGSYELISPDEIPFLDHIDRLNKLLLPITGKPAFQLESNRIEEFGFSKKHTCALIENTCEGELDTGKMMRALTDKAMQVLVEIKTGAEVISYSDEGDKVFTYIEGPFATEPLVIRSKTLILCTNAFTGALMQDEEMKPGRGQVMITEPIANLPFKGIFHFDKGYYYFRELEGRVLFGGGRNLDITGEETTDFGDSEHIQNDLEEKLRTIILPGIDFSIAQKWTGIMAFGPSKFPVVKPVSANVFAAFRLGGMGVALGSEVAARVVALITANRQ